MAYMKRTVHIKRIEYVLSSPTNWIELSKSLTSIQSDLKEECRHWDDSVIVEARDGEIVVWFEDVENRELG